MNFSMIRYIIGWVITFEGIFLSLPTLIAVIFGETKGWSFALVMTVCLAGGVLITRRKPKNTNFYTKEGFVTVAISWIIMSIIGSLPFVFNGDIANPMNALFETISGFTTTGASILSDVEVLAKCSLFWRSFTHWIGGMGVFVFLLAIMPLVGGKNIHLMRAESPGPSVEKLVPKVRKSSIILYGIYCFMTLVEVVFLIFGGLDLFESLLISFGTAGTGGFSILNSGFANYTPYIQYVVTIFMILFGVNFNVYYLILIRKVKEAFHYEELRYYLFVIFAAIALITFNIRGLFPSIEAAFRNASFQVGSIITTTGFASANFNEWPEFSKTILVLLMFVGACAGSTGGGIKVSRVILMLKTVKKELLYYVHPRNIRKIKFNGHLVEHEVVRGVNVFFITYCMILIFSTALIALDNFDFITNFTAVVATLNNIGPGLELVGPAGNFGMFSPFSKFVLMFDMLAGRLELFPMLMLLSPYTWSEVGKRRSKRKN
ncbi:MAG: TrkH family potassium uptake protein [Anaerostipes sp.]|nr:TrkH family potassium uptake protein [Anaerostipes sp.]MDD3745886.1 TrkH family potassium uptake protein [Anaerostipes sp.]